MVSRNIVRIYDRYINWQQFRRVRATVWHDRYLQCLHSHRTCWCAIQCSGYDVLRHSPPRTRNALVYIFVSIDYCALLRLSNPVTVKANQVSGRNIPRCESVLNLSWRWNEIRIFLESWILTLVQVKPYHPILRNRIDLPSSISTINDARYTTRRKVELIFCHRDDFNALFRGERAIISGRQECCGMWSRNFTSRRVWWIVRWN